MNKVVIGFHKKYIKEKEKRSDYRAFGSQFTNTQIEIVGNLI